MSKKLKFPVAKVREDGTPAIWLTHGTWMLIEPGLFRSYITARERIGQREARIHCARVDGLLDAWPFDIGSARDALELYQVGYNANKSTDAFLSVREMTPEKMIAIGDKLQQRAFDEELKKLLADPPTVVCRPELLAMAA